jgi:hypothetical protein
MTDLVFQTATDSRIELPLEISEAAHGVYDESLLAFGQKERVGGEFRKLWQATSIQGP